MSNIDCNPPHEGFECKYPDCINYKKPKTVQETLFQSRAQIKLAKETPWKIKQGRLSGNLRSGWM